MGDGARVDSIDALRHFRIALFKFQEVANSALADVDGELHKTQSWLDNEQQNYWQSQIRKRHEILERAKEALRMKKLFKDSSGRIPSAVDEEKAVRLAQVRIEEAQSKFAACKKYSRVLQHEIQNYKGTVQRFATTVEADIPTAAAALDGMIAMLEQYVMLAPGDMQSNVPPGASEAAPTDAPPSADPTGQTPQS
jgi:hypothetical protein